MIKPKIFIASCERIRPLAEALKHKIDNSGVAQAHAWFDQDRAFKPGSNTLDILLRKCWECDCAAVFLTKDDLLARKKQRIRVPRDNCIFELGLFMGALDSIPGEALDSNPKRCFMLTSVEEKALPSDLKGCTYIKIKEPADIKNPEQCKTAIEAAANQIYNTIAGLSSFSRPRLRFVSKEKLIDLEKPKQDGGNLKDVSGMSVVVNTAQPLEHDFKFAARVRQNMAVGINYHYFFHGKPERASLIAYLLQTLTIADLRDGNPEERQNVMKENQEKIKSSLDVIRSHLNIHFLPVGEAPIQFCVHNAQSQDDALCYLRYSVADFVFWCKEKDAQEVAEDLLKYRQKAHQPVIFRSTRNFNLYSQTSSVELELRTELENQIQEQFHDSVLNKVREVCFAN